MNWLAIFEVVKKAIPILDASAWKCEREEILSKAKQKFTVDKVFLNARGIQFNVAGGPVLHAVVNPAHPKYMDVEVDGVLDPAARLVPRLTGQPFAGKPVILILTFRPVAGFRWRFDCPK